MNQLTYVYTPAVGPASRAAAVTSDYQDHRELARADARWDPLLVCAALYLFSAVGRIHQLFPVVDVVRPALVTALIAIGLYLNDPSAIRKSRLVWVPTTKFLVTLLGWMIVCVPMALVRGTSFDNVFDAFIKTVVMFIVTAGAVRGLRDLERLAGVYLACATLFSLVVMARFDLGAGDQWRLGKLYYYDANDLATFIVSALPFGLYLLHAGRNVLTRMCALSAMGVLAVVFVRTGSRGGFIALMVVAVMIVVRYSAIPLRWRIGATALVAAVVLGTASATYWTQMNTTLSDTDYNRTDESGRMKIWERGIGYTLDNPIFGVGPGNFPAAEGRLSPFANRAQFGYGVRWNAPHNSYLQIAAETGIPGFVLFLMMVGSALAALRRLGRKNGDAPDAEHRVMAQTLNASFVGFLVGAFFLSLAYSEILYTLLAMTVALQKIAQQRRDELAA